MYTSTASILEELLNSTNSLLPLNLVLVAVVSILVFLLIRITVKQKRNFRVQLNGKQIDLESSKGNDVVAKLDSIIGMTCSNCYEINLQKTKQVVAMSEEIGKLKYDYLTHKLTRKGKVFIIKLRSLYLNKLKKSDCANYQFIIYTWFEILEVEINDRVYNASFSYLITNLKDRHAYVSDFWEYIKSEGERIFEDLWLDTEDTNLEIVLTMIRSLYVSSKEELDNFFADLLNTYADITSQIRQLELKRELIILNNNKNRSL